MRLPQLPPLHHLFLPLGQAGERWRFRNQLATNHPRTSFQTRVLGSGSLKAFFVDGLFSSASDVVWLQFLSVYALALGASAAEVGAIAIASGLAGALGLPVGVWLADRAPSLKRIVLLGGGGGARATMVLLAMLPFVFDAREAVYPLIFLAGVRSFAGQASHPAWTALLTKFVPIDIRRLYTSRRLLGASIVVVIAAPLFGRLIGAVGGIEGFQAAFLVAALLGFCATIAYARISEPPVRADVPRAHGSYAAMLRDAGFRTYLGGTLLLHTSVMIAGPFFSVYLVRTLGASPEQVGALGSVDAVSAVVGQAFAGGLAVRYGSRRLLLTGGLIVPALPLIWAVIDSPWQAVLPNALGGAAWAMFNLAAFNLLLEYAPEDNVPRYAAGHQIAVLMSSSVGPFIGTAVVANSSVPTAFVISGVGRIAALGVLMRAGRAAGAPENR